MGRGPANRVRPVGRVGTSGYGHGVKSYSRGPLTFDVLDGGPADGPVVVLLHGFPQDHHAFDRVAPLLHAAGLRTLAPLQRGYAPSSRPPTSAGAGAYSIDELVGDVVALADAAGADRLHVVGHDWGGAVAWAVAERAPERVASVTVLSTPHPRALAWATRHAGQWRKSWYMGAFQIPWLPERLIGRVMPRALRRSGLPEDDLRRYRRLIDDVPTARAMLGWYRALGVRDATPREIRTRRRVVAPAALVWGRDDLALGRAAAERTGRYVDGDYTFTELDANHWLPETHPEQVAEAIIARIRSV